MDKFSNFEVMERVQKKKELTNTVRTRKLEHLRHNAVCNLPQVYIYRARSKGEGIREEGARLVKELEILV